MNAIAISLAALALIMAVVAVGALIDMHDQLEALQDANTGADVVQTLPDLTRDLMGRDPAEFGLSIPESQRERHNVLFLSLSCSLCEVVASRMGGQVPSNTSIVVSTAEPEKVPAWLSTVGLVESDVQVDRDHLIALGLNLSTRPGLVAVLDGAIAFVAAVPSFRALERVAEEAFLPGDAFNIRVEVMRDEPWRRSGPSTPS